MATGNQDQSVHLNKGEQRSPLNEQQIQRMIDYLSEHTDYRIITNDEYQLLRPTDHSTPARTTESGARPKDRTVKFENPSDSQFQPAEMRTSFVYDASNVRPRFTNFSGEEKSETSFEVWKNDVKCALRDGTASTGIILQAIRSSLKGKARSSLLTLPTDATPEQILQKLEGIYGNIYPSEKLLQQFYEAKQQDGETVADYGMRLENLIQTCIDRNTINSASRNEMLRTKLWSGLSDIGLRNASRYKYDTITDFETLRRELRTIELDLKTSASTTASSSGSVSGDKKKSQVSQISKPDIDASLNAVLKKLEEMDTRMMEVEREVKRSRNDNRTSTQNDSSAQSGSRGYNNNRGQNYKSFGKGRFKSRNNNHQGNSYRRKREYSRNDDDLNE